MQTDTWAIYELADGTARVDREGVSDKRDAVGPLKLRRPPLFYRSAAEAEQDATQQAIAFTTHRQPK